MMKSLFWGAIEIVDMMENSKSSKMMGTFGVNFMATVVGDVFPVLITYHAVFF